MDQQAGMNRLLPQSTLDARKKRRRSGDVTTSVKLPRSLDVALKREAKKQQRSQSWLIREALQSYLSFRRSENPMTKELAEDLTRRAT